MLLNPLSRDTGLKCLILIVGLSYFCIYLASDTFNQRVETPQSVKSYLLKDKYDHSFRVSKAAFD